MILDDEYIKEQAHKPCFWTKEYGFDVVSFTHAMEQNYSNRVGAKINAQKKELAEYKKDAERYQWLCEQNEKGNSYFHLGIAAIGISCWRNKRELDDLFDKARRTE